MTHNVGHLTLLVMVVMMSVTPLATADDVQPVHFAWPVFSQEPKVTPPLTVAAPSPLKCRLLSVASCRCSGADRMCVPCSR